MVRAQGKRPDEIILELVRYLAGDLREQTVVFLKDKPTTERLALKMGDTVDFGPAEGALEELRSLEESLSKELLIQVLKKGIGIHTADL